MREYPLFPYKITVDNNSWWPADQWCEEMFGRKYSWSRFPDGRWSVNSVGLGMKHPAMLNFHFRNEEDAVIFALKWGVK